MTIEKRGNKWRISQMQNGHRYRITVDHKPTKAEAMSLIVMEMKSPTASVNMTFYDAADAYITSKSNILSPCTIRNYRAILSKLPERFKASSVNGLSAMDIQRLINDLSSEMSAKTVQNYSSFVMSVLKACDIDIKSPRLPQKERKPIYIPSEEDVRRIFEAAKGTEYEVPFRLAALGLRRSEICALTIDDLDGDVLHITKALVPDENGEYVIKLPKTTDSTRDIPLPAPVAAQIRERGYIYRGNPNSLTKALYRLQDGLEIPHFSIHKLRHFFASFLHGKFTEAQIMEMGGWRTNTVLNRIYTHAMDMDSSKKEMADAICSL